MVFKLEIKNVRMTDVGVGISVPKGSDADVLMDDVSMTRGRALAEERDEPGLVERLGLPVDTPVDSLLEVLRALQVEPQASPAQRMETLKKSSLWTFVERSADTATVIQAIAALAAVTIF